MSVVQVQGTSDNPLIMKEIVLSEVTPQGILHLPPSFSVRNETHHNCHYRITFLKDIPKSHWIDHKEFGISIVPLYLELDEGDSIEIKGLPMSSDDSNEGMNEFEKIAWNSSFNSAFENIEFNTLFQDICINFTGEWNWLKSKAILSITLYFDNKNMLPSFCPAGMERCDCEHSSDNRTRRCISKDLFCNNVENCGVGCRFDEETCQISQYKEACLWTNFEYLLMMFMTGLLLILIPAVFLLTMMYHRRMNQGRCPTTPPVAFDGNNNFNRSSTGQYPHVITVPPPNDTPPTYDELPDEIKVPSRDRQPQQSI